MKKSLIALAVAGAFAAPAFAATSNVDVYGILNIAIEQNNTAATNDIAVVDNVSRIGFKGSEDLGGGLKAIWQIESGLSGSPSVAGNGVGGATLAGRNTFVGLAGGFGTFLMGRHDTPYKLGTLSLDIFGDTIADYNGGMAAGLATGRLAGVDLLMNAHDARSPQAFAYISPTWSGFHFAVAGIATNTSAATGNGNSGDAIDGVSATGVYVNGPLFLSLSYQKVQDADNFVGIAGGTADESSAWKLGASYAFGDAKVGFVYEDVNTDLTVPLGGNNNVDRKSWLLNGSYTMGPMVLKAEYGRLSNSSGYQFVTAQGSHPTLWALGLDYNLSKRTTAYVVYAKGDNDAAIDESGYNIGIKQSF